MRDLFLYEECRYKRWQDTRHSTLGSYLAVLIILYTTYSCLLLEHLLSSFFLRYQLQIFLSFDSNFIDLWMHPFTFLFSQKRLIPLLCFCMPAYISHCICCVILQFTYVCIFFQKITNCLRSGAILLHTYSA